MGFKIGIISTMAGAAWAGSEELWAATALEALRLGHEVILSVIGWPEAPPKLIELQGSGAKILSRNHPKTGMHAGPFGPASNFIDVFKMNPNVIVISQGFCFEFLYRLDLLELLYTQRIPFILICQFNDGLPELTDDQRRVQVSRIFARAFRVLFVSDQNRISAERQLAERIPNSDLVLNPVNLLDPSYVPWPESIPARFASVARLETLYKGQDVLIETLSTDQWRSRDWHLTLYGSGPDESYLRSLAQFFGLQERITFAGHQKDVRGIWAKEHFLVMLSRSEGTPLALVEAMLCGRPAIVTDVGGNKEWVTDTETGFVAEAPVVGLAGAAFERAWSVRKDWKEMGMRAHEFATDRLSELNIPPLLDVILEAAQQKKPLAPASAEELKRLSEFRKLMEPSLGKQAKRIARAGVHYMRRILGRYRAAITGR